MYFRFLLVVVFLCCSIFGHSFVHADNKLDGSKTKVGKSVKKGDIDPNEAVKSNQTNQNETIADNSSLSGSDGSNSKDSKSLSFKDSNIKLNDSIDLITLDSNFDLSGVTFSDDMQKMLDEYKYKQESCLDVKENFEKKKQFIENGWNNKYSLDDVKQESIGEKIEFVSNSIEDQKSLLSEYEQSLEFIQSREKLTDFSKEKLYSNYRSLLNSKNYKINPEFLLLHEQLKTIRLEDFTRSNRIYLLKLSIEKINSIQIEFSNYLLSLKEQDILERNEETRQIINKAEDINVKDNSGDQSALLKSILDELKESNMEFSSFLIMKKDADNSFFKMKNKRLELQSSIYDSDSDNISLRIQSFNHILSSDLEINDRAKERILQLQKKILELHSHRYVNKKKLDDFNSEIALQENMGGLLSKNQSLIIESHKKLIKNYDDQILQATEIKNLYSNVIQEYNLLRKFIDEVVIWRKDYDVIDLNWFKSLYKIIHRLFFIKMTPWLKENLNFDSKIWYFLLVSLCFIALFHDVLSKRFKNSLSASLSPMQSYGFKLSYSINKLLLTIVYAFLYPLFLIFLSQFMSHSSDALIAGIGASVEKFSLYLFAFTLIFCLSARDGLLHKSFRVPMVYLNKLKLMLSLFFSLSIFVVLPFLFIRSYFLYSVYDTLGRFCFIIINFLLSLAVFRVLSLNKDIVYSFFKSKFLYYFLLFFFSLVPLFCIVSSYFGYFESSVIIFNQLIQSIIVGFLFLLLFLFLNHWLFLQKRDIVLKRRRQELQSIYEAKSASSSFSKDDVLRNDILSKREEEIYSLNLKGAAKETLQLIKIVLVLFFSFVLYNIWSSTQDLILSFLNDIEILQFSSRSSDGQTADITAKSVLLFLFISALSMFLIKKLPSLLELFVLQKISLTPGSHYAIMAVTRYCFIIIAVFLAFDYLGVPWENLQFVAATLTFALGFGLRDIIGNFFSGIVILFEKPIRIGDTVTIDNLTGSVSKIHLRATTIIDWDRKEVVVPNSVFVTKNLINWSLSDPITRVVIKVPVVRDSDSELVENLLYSVLEECDLLLDIPKPEIWFSGFGSHSQDFEIRVFVKDIDHRWPVRHQIHNKITKIFKENNITVAYPEMRVRM